LDYLVGVDLFFPDQAGGAGRVAWDQMRLMRDRGHSVTVFCRKCSHAQSEVEEYDGIRVVRFSLPKTRQFDPSKFQRQKQAGLNIARKYLSGTSWDVVHSHTFLYGLILYGLLGKGPRYIYTSHSPVVLEQEANWAPEGLKGRLKMLLAGGILKRLEGDVIGKAQRIQTLSEFTKNTIDRDHHCADKVSVIPHWCREGFSRVYSKAEARRKLNWPADGKILFTVRRLVPRMGLDVAIKGLSPLLHRYKDVNFAIAGAGPLENNLKELTRTLGVYEKVWFLGRVDDETLKRCYEGADLFILPTTALECFGLPILEAFAFGLPIISTDTSALPEIMAPILPDCMVPAGDAQKLGEKVNDYLEGRLVMPDADKLVSYVKNNYGVEVIVPRIAEFLEH
jgi:glycosyltransferase involved in cell wall biosynthesis